MLPKFIMFSLKGSSPWRNAANCTLFKVVSDGEGSNLGKIAPRMPILNKRTNNGPVWIQKPGQLILCALPSSWGKMYWTRSLSYIHAPFPALTAARSFGFLRVASSPPMMKGLEHRENRMSVLSLIVFIKLKKLTHPSISVGISCLHIFEGFGWVQLLFLPIPIVCSKSFIIWKSELTFLPVPV